MEKNPDNSLVEDSSYSEQPESEQSFVGKFKSILTNTPIVSKWFRKQDDINRSTIRRREDFEDDDDEEQRMQPPYKKVKLPVEETNCNNYSYTEKLSANESDKRRDFAPEPVAGPSGIQSRKLINNSVITSVRSTFHHSEIVNGHKDSDSEESTSGYSSVARIGSKEHVCESQPASKQTSPLQHSSNNSRSIFETSKSTMPRSLFLDRNTSPNMNTSLTSRRPCFNASTFGSPNFIDRTLLTKNIMNSPFYSGKTIYGGASAYGRTLGRSATDLKTSLKNSVHIKPVNESNENGYVPLGKTARRILETLEQYTSPVTDAKKIPTVSKKPKTEGILTKYIGAHPYSKGASSKELQVPSVSDLLKMKQKTRLQDSTEAVRKIAEKSRSNLNTESYKLATEESGKERHTGKMKSKITAIRQKPVENEAPPTLNLSNISLPITTLPKFDLVIPPPPLKVSKTPEKVTDPAAKYISSTSSFESSKTQPKRETLDMKSKIQNETKMSSTIQYKFSEPVVIAENIKSIRAINNFKFSEPIKAKPGDAISNVSVNFKMPENKPPTLVPKIKNNGETGSVGIKPAPVLKTGSVMDILGKKDESLAEKFKPPVGTWECSACLVRNPVEKTKCLACETPKAKPETKLSQTNKNEFGNQFKLSTDKWECSVCMVRNNLSDSKCIACTTPKPSHGPAKVTPTPKLSSSFDAGKGTSDFGNKFKLSGDMWECPVCMVRNKNELTNCVSCEALNPKRDSSVTSSSFDNKFKPLPSSWECSACLVRNKEDATKCIACDTPKSGTKAQTSSTFGDSFKMKTNEWECSVCLVKNKSDDLKCQCCEAAKPGESLKTVAAKEKPIASFNFGIDKASSFSFGIPPTANTEAPKLDVKPSAVFGETAKPIATATSFSFGVQSELQNKKPTSTTNSNVTSIPVLTTSNPLLKPEEKLPEKVQPAPAGFQFNINPKTSVAPPISSQSDKRQTTKLTPVTTIGEVPTFSFSKPATSENLFASKVGSSKSLGETSSTNQANLFVFGSKPSAAAAPLVPQSTNKKRAQPTTSAPLFKFGSSSEPAASTASLFGTSNATSVNNSLSAPSSIKFDSNNSPSFKLPSTNSSEVKPFSFESTPSTSGEPPTKAPMFSFGQSPGTSVAPQPAQTSGFNFAAPSSSPSFSFTGGNAATTPATNTFGSVTQSTPTTTFFGNPSANTNIQKAGFNFGSSSSQAGFNFGSAQTSSSSGGFNFSAAPAVFDASARPTFNFTDGTVTSFTAQPTADGTTQAPRKIKRAVRRTQR